MSEIVPVYLEISSWMEVGSIGAEHYYGKLVLTEPYTRIELEYRITAKQAAILNKKDRWDGWKAGHLSSRFESREDIIELAIKTYKEHFPQANMLILGRSSLAEPQKILDGPKELMEVGNQLFDEVEKIGWVERYGFYYRPPGGDVKLDRLRHKWDKLGLP